MDEQTAQQAQQAVSTATDVVTDPNVFHYLAQFFQDGGSWMWAILFVMIGAIAVSIDRAYRVFVVYSIDGDSFFAKVQKFVLDNSIDRAINLCNGKTGSVLPRVLKAGLMRAQGSETEIQSAVDEATLEVLPMVEKRGLFLPMIANIATLLGLLGTIMGLISAFQSLGAAAPDERAAALAAAIAVAMNTTAFGLVVAIPAMMMQTFIQSRANQILADIDQYAIRIVNLLLQAKKK